MKKIPSHIPLLIVGATCSGIARLLNAPKDSLLVEAGSSLGHEYVQAMNPGEVKSQRTRPRSPWMKKFTDLLRERDVIRSGRWSLPFVAPILAEMLLASKKRVLLQCEVLECEACDGGFRVQLLHRSGVSEVLAQRVVDTTDLALSSSHAPQCHDHWLYASLAKLEGRAEDLQGRGWHCIKGRHKDEAYFGLKLSSPGWEGARSEFMSFWRERPKVLRDYQLLCLASELCKEVRPLEDLPLGWNHEPSSACGSPLVAFQVGCEDMEKELV